MAENNRRADSRGRGRGGERGTRPGTPRGTRRGPGHGYGHQGRTGNVGRNGTGRDNQNRAESRGTSRDTNNAPESDQGQGGAGGTTRNAPDQTQAINEAVHQFEDEFCLRTKTLPPKGKYPLRPGFGTKSEKKEGLEVSANYLEIGISKDLTWFKYPLLIEEVDEKTGAAKEPELDENGNPKIQKRPAAQTRRIVEDFIELEGKFPDAVTDYSSFIALGSKFDEDSYSQIVPLKRKTDAKPKEGASIFEVKLGIPERISVAEFLSFLKSSDIKEEPAQIAHGSAIQLLNCAITQYAQRLDTSGEPSTIAMFKSKIFSLPAPRGDHLQGVSVQVPRLDDSGKKIVFKKRMVMQKPKFREAREEGSMRFHNKTFVVRGVFKSIRPATGRPLLNVNPSHCVFYPHVSLKDFLEKPEEAADPNAYAAYLRRTHSLLKSVKITRDHLDDKSERTIWGLAHPRDHRPKETLKGASKEGGKEDSVKATAEGQPEAGRPTEEQDTKSKRTKLGAGPKDVGFYKEKKAADTTANKDGQTTAPDTGRDPQKKDDEYITVHDHFIRDHSEKLPGRKLDDKLPVINIGSNKKPVYLPAEVCTIVPGQRYKRKINADTQDMIQFAARTPQDNIAWFQKMMRGELKKTFGLSAEGNEMMKKLGITVDNSLITVPARRLPAPVIKYQGDEVKGVKDGSWNLVEGEDSIKFHQPATMPPWSVVWFQKGKANMTDLNFWKQIDVFQEQLEKTGLDCTKKYDPITKDLPKDAKNSKKIDYDAIEQILRQVAEKKGLIIIILPFRDTALYQKIKTICDTKIGKASVCMLQNTIITKKGSPLKQYFANVALKVNQKMEGINHVLDGADLGIINEGNTMVVGIDVTHPQPGAKESAPSIAAMVASVDKTLSHWPGDIRVQASREEIIKDGLGEIFKSRLRLWEKCNGTLPENIIVYRDGVSEGQYNHVLDIELMEMQKACYSMYLDAVNGKQPKMCVIVVGKRHHTRFYPTQGKKGEQTKTGNCIPGTVVDRGITEVQNWEFYMQAHAAIQGTARPAHYVVIWDEVFQGRKDAADELEKITFNLCHLFARATKAVSYCTPAYYADLLCTRARCYYNALYGNGEEGTGEEGSTDDVEDDSSNDATTDAGDLHIQVHEAIRDTMFYI